jgi:hypothetical protein
MATSGVATVSSFAAIIEKPAKLVEVLASAPADADGTPLASVLLGTAETSVCVRGTIKLAAESAAVRFAEGADVFR